MTDERRFVVHPGTAVSRTDGDRHRVGVAALLRLHEVDPRRHRVVVDGPGLRALPGDVHLRPRRDGEYPIFGRS